MNRNTFWNHSCVCAGFLDNRVDDGDIASGGTVGVGDSPGYIICTIDVMHEIPETVVKHSRPGWKKAVTVNVTAWRKNFVHLAARGNT